MRITARRSALLVTLSMLLLAACGGASESPTAIVAGGEEPQVAETEAAPVETETPTDMPTPTEEVDPYTAALRAVIANPCALTPESDIDALDARVIVERPLTDEPGSPEDNGAMMGSCVYGEQYRLTVVVPQRGTVVEVAFAKLYPDDALDASGAGDTRFWVEEERTLYALGDGLWITVVALNDNGDPLLGAGNLVSIARRYLPDRPDTQPAEAAATVAFADPCSLLTVPEVEAQFGALTADPSFDGSAQPEPGDAQACSYMAEGNFLRLTVNRYENADDARADFDSFFLDDAETIAGLGDDAYWIPDNSNMLRILSGVDVLSLSMNLTSGDGRAIADALGPVALARLTGDEVSDTASGGPATPDSAASFSPCDAMTIQQAEGILGTLSSPPQPGAAVGEQYGEFKTCQYIGAQGSAYLSYKHFGSGQDALAYYNNGLANASDAETLFGYGDAAYWSPSQGSIVAVRGTLALSVTTGDRTQGLDIAGIALVRIP